MLVYTHQEIINYLQKWFEANKNNPKIWHDPIGAVIKNEMFKLGYFKNLPRGKYNKKEIENEENGVGNVEVNTNDFSDMEETPF